jgi:uncharacterized protein YdaL
MYQILRRFLLALLFLCAATTSIMPAQAQTTAVKALVLYDAPTGTPYDKIGFSYAIMLKNLLGHFDGQVDLLPVQSYTAGKLATYSATFYLGASYDNSGVPAALLSDVMANANAPAPKTVVWFKYNLWKLAWADTTTFAATFGFSFDGVSGLNAPPSAQNQTPGFYDTVTYKSMNMVKYYAYDSASNSAATDPDVGATTVINTALARTVVPVTNGVTKKQLPYVLQAGKAQHFWYFADIPFSFIGPRDRYLVLTDLLHDIVGINHAVNHQAMVRLEDVSAIVDANAMKTLTDYLSGKKIPFAIATIPYYNDPLGSYNGGVAQRIPMSQATTLKRALNYALTRGAEIVMHGYTHQYSNVPNRYTAVSGDDYEFWNIVQNTPVKEDSQAWASGRLQSGLRELTTNGYNPVAWEAPHYQSSPNSIKAVPPLFSTTYQRVVYYTADTPNLTAAISRDYAVGQLYPYVIKKDYYGQRVLPENLGNIEYIIAGDPASTYNYTAQDIITNAQFALTVRDGVASFFFHPFWLEADVNKPGYADFQAVINGISSLGFTWVKPSLVQ